MTTHKGIYLFKCSYCEEGFQNKKGLKTHIRKKHEGIYFHCRAVKENGLEYGKIIISEEGIIDHIEKQHFCGNKSPCTQCDLLVFPCLLSEHVKRKHLEDSSGELQGNWPNFGSFANTHGHRALQARARMV